jgi:chromosome segregation ATPase
MGDTIDFDFDFDFIPQIKERMNKVNVDLKNTKNKIQEYEKDLIDINDTILTLNNKKIEITGKIEQFKEQEKLINTLNKRLIHIYNNIKSEAKTLLNYSNDDVCFNGPIDET